jgi:hypothetical protein|nr:hypothetical protein [uncultured Flavobacterium sp.]
MPKTTLLFLILFAFTSCKYKENSWLKNYKEIKCNYAKVEELRSNDSLKKISKIGKELSEIKLEISKIEKPITHEISKLENSKGEIVIKYLNASNKITQIQTDKYGHNSTPEFERKLAKNERKGNSETKVFENKIEFLNQQLVQNSKYQELKIKESKIKSEINEAYISIKEKYAKQFETLQNDLNYLNSQFKEIISDLDEKEKQIFIRKKENIKENPCKI